MKPSGSFDVPGAARIVVCAPAGDGALAGDASGAIWRGTRNGHVELVARVDGWITALLADGDAIVAGADSGQVVRVHGASQRVTRLARTGILELARGGDGLTATTEDGRCWRLVDDEWQALATGRTAPSLVGGADAIELHIDGGPVCRVTRTDLASLAGDGALAAVVATNERVIACTSAAWRVVDFDALASALSPGVRVVFVSDESGPTLGRLSSTAGAVRGVVRSGTGNLVGRIEQRVGGLCPARTWMSGVTLPNARTIAICRGRSAITVHDTAAPREDSRQLAVGEALLGMVALDDDLLLLAGAAGGLRLIDVESATQLGAATARGSLVGARRHDSQSELLTWTTANAVNWWARDAA